MKNLILVFFFIICSSCGSQKVIVEKKDTKIVAENVNPFSPFTKQLHFKPSTDELIENSDLYLRQIAALINKNTQENVVFEISGHTDSVGDKELNKILSQKRADKIKALLIQNGCNASVLKAIGYGEKQPIATDKTREGRALNRRVEIRSHSN